MGVKARGCWDSERKTLRRVFYNVIKMKFYDFYIDRIIIFHLSILFNIVYMYSFYEWIRIKSRRHALLARRLTIKLVSEGCGAISNSHIQYITRLSRITVTHVEQTMHCIETASINFATNSDGYWIMRTKIHKLCYPLLERIEFTSNHFFILKPENFASSHVFRIELGKKFPVL